MNNNLEILLRLFIGVAKKIDIFLITVLRSLKVLNFNSFNNCRVCVVYTLKCLDWSAANIPQPSELQLIHMMH